MCKALILFYDYKLKDTKNINFIIKLMFNMCNNIKKKNKYNFYNYKNYIYYIYKYEF